VQRKRFSSVGQIVNIGIVDVLLLLFFNN